MNHKIFEKLIQKSFDNTLTEYEQQRLNEHLKHCAECYQFYQELAQLSAHLRNLPEYFPKQGFNSRIITKLGFARKQVWKKLIPISVGIWILSQICAFSLFWADIKLDKLLTSVPTIVRFTRNVQFLISDATHLLLPFIKNSLDPYFTLAALFLSICFLYIINKVLKKEEKCSI